MKLPEPVDLSVKELIHNLPELLEGKEPILTRPRVLDYLKTDPTAGAAIQAVAHAARAMSGASDWMHSLPPRSASSLMRPVETARKYFRKEMVDLMFAVGLAEFERATWRMGRAFDSHALGARACENVDLRLVPTQLAEALGLSEAAPAGLAAYLSMNGGGDQTRQGLEKAEHLVRACEDLWPGTSGTIQFYRIVLPQLREGTHEPKVWVEFVRSSSEHLNRKSGLCRAASDALHLEDFDLALRASQEADCYSPPSWFPAYTCALIRCLSGDRQGTIFEVERCQELLGGSDAWNILAAHRVQLDLPLWRRAARDNPHAVETAASRMPRNAARILQEVML